jgi:hypothetical protein
MSREHGRGGIMLVIGRRNRFIQRKSVEARAKRAEAAAAAVLMAGTSSSAFAPSAPPSERLHRKLEDLKKSVAKSSIEGEMWNGCFRPCVSRT